MSSAYIYSKRWSDSITLLTLVKKWKGSIFQLILLDLLGYLALYGVITVTYRNIMNKSQQTDFEHFVKYMRKKQNMIPLSFLLGFFVSHVLSKWWSIICTVPWMLWPSFLIQSYITTSNENELDIVRHIRRTLLRYINGAIIIGLRPLCDPVQKRFANIRQDPIDHIVRNVKKCCIKDKLKDIPIRERLEQINRDKEVKDTFGFLFNDAEIEAYERIGKRQGNTYDLESRVPLQWGTRLLEKARQCGFIDSNREYTILIDLLNSIRGSLAMLDLYESYANHLVYTQVTIIAVYTYFTLKLFASQFLMGADTDFYFPVFTTFEFIFYMGWFKIGYALMNPLSDSPLDLDTNMTVSYNLKISIECGVAPDESFPIWLKEAADPKEVIMKGLLHRDNALPQMEMVENEGQIVSEEEKVLFSAKDDAPVGEEEIELIVKE